MAATSKPRVQKGKRKMKITKMTDKSPADQLASNVVDGPPQKKSKLQGQKSSKTNKAISRNRKEKKSEETTAKNVVISQPQDKQSSKLAPTDQEKPKWTNKQRVLVFSSRGVSYRDRHLMNDIRMMLPHSKPDSKMDKRDTLSAINEICEMKNCNKCLYFEARKKKDLYLWVSNVCRGPSAKFLVENVHTMLELRMTGNCLRGSRGVLSFDKTFDAQPHWKIIKELLTQIFGTPLYHPKSQPFLDHVLTFSVQDERVWFRNYQIVDEDGALAEIGPRFVLNPIRIFQGSFGGPTLYENPNYVSPNLRRREQRLLSSGRYVQRVESGRAREMRAEQLRREAPQPAAHDDDSIYKNM